MRTPPVPARLQIGWPQRARPGRPARPRRGPAAAAIRPRDGEAAESARGAADPGRRPRRSRTARGGPRASHCAIGACRRPRRTHAGATLRAEATGSILPRRKAERVACRSTNFTVQGARPDSRNWSALTPRPTGSSARSADTGASSGNSACFPPTPPRPARRRRRRAVAAAAVRAGCVRWLEEVERRQQNPPREWWVVSPARACGVLKVAGPALACGVLMGAELLRRSRDCPHPRPMSSLRPSRRGC